MQQQPPALRTDCRQGKRQVLVVLAECTAYCRQARKKSKASRVQPERPEMKDPTTVYGPDMSVGSTSGMIVSGRCCGIFSKLTLLIPKNLVNHVPRLGLPL